MCVMFSSVYPLMKESLGILMQRSPQALDHTLPDGLRKVSCVVLVVWPGNINYIYLY